MSGRACRGCVRTVRKPPVRQPPRWLGHTVGVRSKRWSLARQLLVLQTVLLTAVLLAAAVTVFVISRNRDENAARDKVLSVARTVAADPFVAQQAHVARPWIRLQPYAEAV